MQEFLPFPLDDTPPIDRSVSNFRFYSFTIELFRILYIVETSKEFREFQKFVTDIESGTLDISFKNERTNERHLIKIIFSWKSTGRYAKSITVTRRRILITSTFKTNKRPRHIWFRTIRCRWR